MFPTNLKSHLTIGKVWPRVNYHVIIVAENNTLQIACILVTRPISIIPSRSVQLVGAVVDAEVYAEVDVVADTKVTKRSGGRAIIIRMGIEIIMEIVFKIGETLGCAISVVKSVGGILTTPLDFMLLGSVILVFSTFRLTMTNGSCQGGLLVLQMALVPLGEADIAPYTNAV